MFEEVKTGCVDEIISYYKENPLKGEIVVMVFADENEMSVAYCDVSTGELYLTEYKGDDVSVGEDTNILSYADAFVISEYAIPAMQWACGAGIINGRDDGTLNPKGTAQKVHTAQMLMNFIKM